MLDADQLVVHRTLEGEQMPAILATQADERDSELALAIPPALRGIRLIVLLDGLAELDATSGQRSHQTVRVADAVLDLDLMGGGGWHEGSLADTEGPDKEARQRRTD